MRFDKIFLEKMLHIKHLYVALVEEYQVETLHKYRVSLRKIHAYYEIFLQNSEPQKAHGFLKMLKAVIKPTSLLRDLDLFLAESDSFALDAQSKRALQSAIMSARTSLIKELQSDTYKKNLFALDAIFLADLPFQSEFDEKTSYDLLDTIKQKIFREFARIDNKTSMKDLHKLRIKFKKFRYALELYETYFHLYDIEKNFDLKELQDLFGAIQDNEVRKLLLNSFGAALCGEKKLLLLNRFEKNIENARKKLIHKAKAWHV